jgi:hypothetical protein
MRLIIKIQFIIILLFPIVNSAEAQDIMQDTVPIKNGIQKKQEYFYDSLKHKASQKKLTRIIYDFLISPPRPYVDKKEATLNYYSQLEGKLISSIEIKSLDVFGPNFENPSKTTDKWLGRFANTIHTKSNLKSIKKLLLFKVGDFVDAELIYENERIIRSLPYIKDVRFIIKQDSLYSGLVDVTLLTKDRFSFGVSGYVSSNQAAAIEVYNQNILGVGHEISFRFVGHRSQQPYLGLETYYKINNIRGKFIDISFGYLNTYRNEGFAFLYNKPFITPSIKWGYGANALRMFRTNRLFDEDPIETLNPLNVSYYSAWAGRSFQIKSDNPSGTQIVLSAGLNNQKYFHRPIPDPNNNQYFSNSTFYLTGVTFTQRRFVQDQLIYSYGITEDIPEGFKNEIVYGFDANEFGDRHYAHIYLSNGNLLINRKGYLYLAGGIGGYFSKSGYEQGVIKGRVNFISKIVTAGRKRFRLFTHADYTLGIRRYDIENLNLRRDNHIRGFRSREVTGKQRLSLANEYVLFLRKEFYKFNMAIFGFTDIGLIGSNKELLLTQNFYSGIGMGVRLHNENLVFKTFQLRLAFYPFHPNDINFVGFILDEQSKREFYSFEPTAPLPLRFE